MLNTITFLLTLQHCTSCIPIYTCLRPAAESSYQSREAVQFSEVFEGKVACILQDAGLYKTALSDSCSTHVQGLAGAGAVATDAAGWPGQAVV